MVFFLDGEVFEVIDAFGDEVFVLQGLFESIHRILEFLWRLGDGFEFDLSAPVQQVLVKAHGVRMLFPCLHFHPHGKAVQGLAGEPGAHGAVQVFRV